LFRDNTLFEGDQLNGILDFYELNQDEWLFDIAITLNDFCTEYPDVVLNEEKAIAFLNAYETIRPLTSDERACLELYLAMAAGRFWMMRLQVAQRNAALGRTGEDILQKNPDEMRNMLIERLKFVTASTMKSKRIGDMRDPGRLMQWCDAPGYGFSQPSEPAKDRVFLHIKDFAKPGPRPIVGCALDYLVILDERGRYRAQQVMYLKAAQAKSLQAKFKPSKPQQTQKLQPMQIACVLYILFLV